MPRLRDETYAARRQHILDAARACFARRGFHAASMADLQEEAGVSAGALYVYFPCKAGIVSAIAEANLEQLEREIAAIVDVEPAPALRDALLAITRLVDRSATGPTAGLAFDIWGEAVRDPALGRVIRRRFAAIRRRFRDVAAAAVAAGELPRGTDLDAAGTALFAQIGVGYYTLRLTSGDVRPGPYVDGVIAMLRR